MEIEVDPLAFAVDWRAEYVPAMARVRSGERGYVPLDVLHRENLDATLAKHRLHDVLDDKQCWILNAAWEQLSAWDDVTPGLSRLKQHALIAPCSNGSIALMSRLSKFAGLPWDAILGADIAKNYKPQAEVYLACAAALRLSPEEVMMVAAHNDDLKAAKAAGLQTAFVPRIREHGPGQVTDLKASVAADCSAVDFVSLADVLFD
jgi:2-haloacid dehalogenase